MTPRPNIFGYFVLAAFAGAGVYALTRKAKAVSACPPVTAERVAHFNVALDAAIIWLPDESSPPIAVITADNRVSFPGIPGRTFSPPLIVVTKGDRFWRYEGRPGETVQAQPAPDAYDAFCALG